MGLVIVLEKELEMNFKGFGLNVVGLSIPLTMALWKTESFIFTCVLICVFVVSAVVMVENA